MNKKVLTFLAGITLASTLPAAAQLCPDNGEIPYRSREVKAAMLDKYSDVVSIKEPYWYQLQVDPNCIERPETTNASVKSVTTPGSAVNPESGYVLVAERDYSTGKVYLTAKPVTEATLTHSLWQIKVTDRPGNGRVYTFYNKETGYELAFDHTTALTLDGKGRAAEYSDEKFNYEEGGAMDGCITNWAWYTTDQDRKPLEYKRIYSYFHNQTDSVVGLAVMHNYSQDTHILAGLEEAYSWGTNYIIPVKDSKENAGNYLKSEPIYDSYGEYDWLAIKPVVAGAKVLSAAEINTMIDANDSYLKFEGNQNDDNYAISSDPSIAHYDEWEDASKDETTGTKTKFTICHLDSREPMTFASNPFEKEFIAVESKDEDYRREHYTQGSYYIIGEEAIKNYPYAGYDVLFQATDESGFLYVSDQPYEGNAFQHIYNGLQVTVAPYRVYDSTNKELHEYTDYTKVPKEYASTIDALQARYHWKVTYYPTNDSVVFEPLNASRPTSIDQQKGTPFWETKAFTYSNKYWLNTVNKAIDSNEEEEGANGGSQKAAGVPVALYAMNFGLPSGDIASFLTVGYADGEADTDEEGQLGQNTVNPANEKYATQDKRYFLYEEYEAANVYENYNNPAYVTDYQSKMNLVVRFNHSYENPYEKATLEDGLYFINIQNVKADKTQTENRVNGAYVVEDMKGHLVYDTQDDAQNFLDMPATQWVVEQVRCTEGDELNTNKTPYVTIWNREFNSSMGYFEWILSEVTSGNSIKDRDKVFTPAFYGQLYKLKSTGNFITLDHRHYHASNDQNVDHHNRRVNILNCSDEFSFTNITDKQTTNGYFNESEAVLRNSTYKFQHLHGMKADKFLGEDNGYVKLTNDGTEFELYRAECWVPTLNYKARTFEFNYTDSIAYGYTNDLVKPLYKTPYKVKVKDENLIDNDHRFLAITNQHKYVIATESEIENSDELTFAIVTLKENNELDGEHAYGLVNQTTYTHVDGTNDELKNLYPKFNSDGTISFYHIYAEKDSVKLVCFKTPEKQVDGKLEIENTSLYAKIADRCETTTDVFFLTQVNRPLYRTLEGEYVNNDQKVLALYTQEGEAFLYEDSSSKLAKANGLNYLAAENKTTTTNNEGFYVDKVAKSTSVMPQYLLAVAADSVPAYTYCTENLHGINPKCGHIAELPGYVTGRYLVNFNDSITNAIDKLTNRADAFRSNNYVRLGFIEALHQGDTLYIMKDGNSLNDYKVAATDNSGDYIIPSFFDAANNGKVYNKVALDGTHNNVAFSFRNTGDEDESFLIESNDLNNQAGIGMFTGAWVKLHNNVPVLTQFKNTNGNHNTGDSTDSWKQYADYTTVASFGEVINQAARFNGKFETKDASATANETIAANDVTVAATTGAVVVKGAAGKAVVITNILGQTLTSTTISSDNATIAVPAGIAVVAVDGEEAVKVVVK